LKIVDIAMMGHNSPIDVISVATFASSLHEESGRTPGALHKPVHGHLSVTRSAFFFHLHLNIGKSAIIISFPSSVNRVVVYKYFTHDSTATHNTDVGVYNYEKGSQLTENRVGQSVSTITDIKPYKNTK
jgi:hypothetical protein